MQAIRTIQQVSGPTLTIEVPVEFAGKQVEVIVLPMESVTDARYAEFIKPKPPLTEAEKKAIAQNPYPLRGIGGDYVDPYGPVVPPEDWEVMGDDPA